MTQSEVTIFFVQISLMLIVALICGQVMRVLHLPAILGELIGGILVGPSFFGAIAPDSFFLLFPDSNNIAIGRDTLLSISIVMFLLVVGMEINIGQLKTRGVNVIWTSLLGILFPFAMGFALVIFVPSIWGTQKNILLFALFIGTALSISALPVIARILMDMNLLKSKIGTVIIASASINDLIGWFLLAVLMNIFIFNDDSVRNIWLMLVQIVVLFAFILTIGRWLAQRVLRWYESRFSNSGILISVFIVLALIGASVTEAIGIHAIFGAFLVGIAIAQNKETRSKSHETIYMFVNYFFAPLYFVSIGLRADFVSNFDLILTVVLVLVAILGKVIGATIGALISRMRPREALTVGFGMNARGAMEVLITSIALQYQIIDQRIFVALIITSFITTIIASPVIKLLIANQAKTINASSSY